MTSGASAAAERTLLSLCALPQAPYCLSVQAGRWIQLHFTAGLRHAPSSYETSQEGCAGGHQQ